MSEKLLRSRILQYFPNKLMNEISKIVYSNRFNDVNDKAHIILELIESYDIDFSELGTGTNRTAIFIDGYCFKIALDKYGVRDNDQEFTLSKELQPYVIKVYETNSIILVCEYVTLITKEEFIECKEKINMILEDLSNEYLLGDMGTINKNFCNWGRREERNELVCLDFAYIYRIIGEEMLCSNCNTMLRYTADYDRLVCPSCRRKYDFMDIRRKISQKMENMELESDKERAYHISSEVEKVFVSKLDEEDDEIPVEKYTYRANLQDYMMYKKFKEENKMKHKYIDFEEETEVIDDEEDFERELELLSKVKRGELPESCLREDRHEYDPRVEADDLSDSELEAIMGKLESMGTIADFKTSKPKDAVKEPEEQEITLEQITALDDEVKVFVTDSKESVRLCLNNPEDAKLLQKIKEDIRDYVFSFGIDLPRHFTMYVSKEDVERIESENRAQEQVALDNIEQHVEEPSNQYEDLYETFYQQSGNQDNEQLEIQSQVYENKNELGK